MLRRLSPLIASAAVLILLLAGCGGDDDSAEVSATETTGSADGSTTTEAPESSQTTEAPDTTASGGGDVDEFCSAYNDFDAFVDDIPDDTIEQVRDGTAMLVDALDELVDLAPEEIRSDVESVRDGAGQLQEVVDDADTLDEAEQDFDEIDSTEANAAGEAVNTYAEENCAA